MSINIIEKTVSLIRCNLYLNVFCYLFYNLSIHVIYNWNSQLKRSIVCISYFLAENFFFFSVLFIYLFSFCVDVWVCSSQTNIVLRKTIEQYISNKFIYKICSQLLSYEWPHDSCTPHIAAHLHCSQILSTVYFHNELLVVQWEGVWNECKS